MQQVTRALQHQVNNPLTIVYAYAQRILRRKELDPELAQWVEEIKVGAERITKALQDYSQAKNYKTINTPVGPMATPGDDR
jgi:signal transduction histidine kinase